jgi:beta-mannosidase
MTTIDLSGRWTLVRESSRSAVPAIVPGDTHSALLAAGLIPDPYSGRNELDVQWVGREDWSYTRDVEVAAALLDEERVELSCDRLDTMAELFVNGKSAGTADNMFVRWRFDVKRFLRPGRNTLRVLFRSAEQAAVAAARALPYPVPHTQNPVQSPHRNLVRKVQCHSGWDWAPCLMVAGIQGDISLQAFSGARIDYVSTVQRHGKDRCTVTVAAECDAAGEMPAELTVTLGGATVTRRVGLTRGVSSHAVRVVVEHPRLWWPNGYGAQDLYDLSVRVTTDRGTHEERRRIGLRTLKLVSRPDKAGLSMAFEVNGVPVFAKGANWIPFDALPQRQTADRLAHLLSSAAEAGMNMLRVWGGGQYEADRFYDLCDENGLLLWHDMMFSCALYPATREFLANVEREIRHQVKRLRHHACIALWCGNNEDVGALGWFPESRASRDRYLVDYDRLNEGVIGRVVDECDPERTFWPSSPCGGRGDYSDAWHEDGRGDMHYWSVWHEGKPFSAYYDVKPRFCSEFGFQSFPSMSTIKSYAEPSEWNVTSPIMEHHQRNARGNAIITEMFTRYYRVPEGFESFVYLSQVQQAQAIATAVEYWRRLRPHCMGTLYWQLNDTWPVCSWSSIEYDGTWKLLHYAARRFYAPVLLSGQVMDGGLEAWLTNDQRKEAAGRVIMRLLDFAGRELRREVIRVRAAPGSARLVKRWDAGLFAKPTETFVALTLEQGEEPVTSTVFLVEPKRCTLADAKVTAEVKDDDGRIVIDMASDAPAFAVALELPGIPAELSDNGFSLLPGEPRRISVTPRTATTSAAVRRALVVRHLRVTYR